MNELMRNKKIGVYAIASVILLAGLSWSLYWNYTHRKGADEESERQQNELVADLVSEHSSDEHKGVEEETFMALTDPSIQEIGLTIQSAGPGRLAPLIIAKGKLILHPDRMAHVLPKVAGVVKEARKNIGDVVRVGEVLAVLESREMAEAKANYLTALSKENLALSMFNKEARLRSQGISAEQDYLNAKATYEDHDIALRLARQKLYALGLNEQEIEELGQANEPHLRLYEIKAPLEGVVLQRHLTKGELVDSSMTVYQVADLNTIWVEMGLYPKDFSKIREGQWVEINVPGEQETARARLIYVSPVIEEEMIMAKAVAELDNSRGYWRPGTFVNVTIAAEAIPIALVVPQEAVQSINGVDYLFILTSQGVEKRVVKLGRKDQTQVEILAGIDSGERYVASQTFLLKAEMNKTDIDHD